MARTPEEVIRTAYDDGCDVVKERGFRHYWGLGEDVRGADGALHNQSPTIFLDRAVIYADARNLVGLFEGKIDFHIGGLDKLLPIMRLGVSARDPDFEQRHHGHGLLSSAVSKSTLKTYGGWSGWTEISQKPFGGEIQIQGSSAVDIMGLRGVGCDNSWLLDKEKGRLAIREILKDSLNMLERYHRLINLLPQTLA